MYFSRNSEEGGALQPVPAQNEGSSEVIADGSSTILSDSSSTSPRIHQVTLKDFAFVPASLTIIPGDTVVWMNEDSVSHTVTSNSGKELTSSLFGKGETYEHTFTTAGTFSYHCIHHRTMRGTIVVR